MKEKKRFLDRPEVQTILSSLFCILIGVLIAYAVLAVINASGASEAIKTILLNWMSKSSVSSKIKTFGNTLIKTAPLLMCALSVQFCYKVGLFNIGAAGQYTAGAGMALYAALAWHLPWFLCVILAACAGALLGTISGMLKAHRNVNEVISGIMMNWITLYIVNMVLARPEVKDVNSPYTLKLSTYSPGSQLPTLGMELLFPKNNNLATIAIPLAILIAILIWVVQNKTIFGYELQATGYSKDAAKYAGMKENRNIVITLAIGGALAGIGASFLYLSGFQEWSTVQTSVPGMGFNGIAATFLGGLHPIGTIFSSYFIQHITDGGSLIDKMVYPSQISDLMSGIIIYLCGFVLFFKHTMSNYVRKSEEKKQKKGDKE